MIRSLVPDGGVVTAGFYTQCSQLLFALHRPSDPKVRCLSKEMDDFDIWSGPIEIRTPFLFVDDNRFDHDVTQLVQSGTVTSTATLEITRGGRRARIFRFQVVTVDTQN
jgi:hypothetical protein